MAKHPHKLETRALAKVLVERAGLSVGYASDLANGKTVPSYAMALKLEQELRIPMRFWAENARARAA